MADIRIKDLTTTASSSASDDFIAVDGTTNGTRKLNAFSPTFGGNATVTGTLTVNGTGTNSIPNLSVTGIGGLNVSANFLTSANTLRFSDSASGGQTWFMSPQLGDGVATNFAFYSNDGVTSTPLFRVSSAGVFRLPATTASTTTSTGALVVGNGTSGGLGVGGAINAGGNVTISGSGGYAVIGGRQWSFRANSSGGSPASGCVIRDDSAAADRLTIDINGNTSVLTTTASTSTSSGALVVGGGVGVAGAIYAGGYASTASHARIGASGSVVALSAANNVDSGLPAAWNGNYGLGVYYSAASTNTILIGDGSAGTTIFATRTSSANTSRITIDNTNGNTTFAGAVAIGNTVNTVSPTSPNRTITMVIGGTTYYLAAKTTND
jgi:hypothetical protein